MRLFQPIWALLSTRLQTVGSSPKFQTQRKIVEVIQIEQIDGLKQ